MTTNNPQSKGVLVDLTRCIGCRGCQVACKSWNERSVKKTIMDGTFTNPPELNSECYTRILYTEQEKDNVPAWYFTKSQCMHCKDPACVSACPVGALRKTEQGAVVYAFERCIGCRYCMVACPFNIPKYEWEKTAPWIRKCTFCSERISAGKVPACIKVCPTQVMFFGNYDEVVQEAEKRLRDNPGKYVNHIYGKDEAGGTSWIYLSAVPFEQIGFNTKVPNVKLPALTWNMLGEIPVKVGALVVGLSLIAAFRNRGSGSAGSSETKHGKEK
ncbi:MAG TPA: 4Fe-4S dicluster domain-containing protein [Nitrospirota bacterium]